MPHGNRYLVSVRDRTIHRLGPDELDDLGRIVSSQRYVIRDTDTRFQRLLREGYRVTNPQPIQWHPDYPPRHEHFSSATLAKAVARLLNKAGYRAEVQTNKGYGYGIYKVQQSWTMMTDASANTVMLLLKLIERRLEEWDERQFADEYQDLSRRLGEDLRDLQDRTAGDVGRGGRVRGSALNPQTGVHTINSGTLPILRRLATEYGQSKLVRVSPSTTANEMHRQAEILESKGLAKDLEIFKVHDRKGTYGYAPAGLLDQATDIQEQEESRDEGPDPKQLAKAKRAAETLESKIDAIRDKYGAKAGKLIDEANRALDLYERGDSVQAAQVATRVERQCPQERGVGAACRVFLRELTREENPNRRRNGSHGLRRNPDDADPLVMGHYLINKRGARYSGAPDNYLSWYKLGDGRSVSVSWDGWTVSAGAGYPEKSGRNINDLHDWLANEPARQRAREIAAQQERERERELHKLGRTNARVEALIDRIKRGMEKATGEPAQVTGPQPGAIHPEVKISSGGTWVSVDLGSGEYFVQGMGPGKAPKKMFDYLAKYGEWEDPD